MMKNSNNLVKTLSSVFTDSQKNLPKSRLYVSLLILSMDLSILLGVLTQQGFHSQASLLATASQGIVMVSLAFACIGPILVIFFSIYSLFELRIYAQTIFLHGAEKWMIEGICVRSIVYLLKPGVFISLAFTVCTTILAIVLKLASLWLYSLIFVAEIAFMLLGSMIFLYCFIAYILYSFSRGRSKH